MEAITFCYSSTAGWSRSLADLPDWLPSQTLLLLFGGSCYLDDPAPIRALQSRLPGATFIGCSTAGEICATQILDDSLVVAMIRFDQTPFRLVSEPVATMVESFQVGERLAEQLSGPSLKGVFILSDGLHVNGSELARGLNQRLPAEVVVTGGLAGDGERFERTWVLANQSLQASQVAAIGFYGDAIRIGYGSKGGWDIFGLERRVTHSQGNILFALDGRPALELYKTYLGDLADGLPATGLLFPLALRRAADDQHQLVRTILAVDETQQSLTFAGDISEGWYAQLMRANFERLIEGAEQAAFSAGEVSSSQNGALLIAISCVGRRLVLGERSDEEVEASLEALGGAVAQIGFYSYGELSPFTDDGRCDLHNQTMTLSLLSEVDE